MGTSRDAYDNQEKPSKEVSGSVPNKELRAIAYYHAQEAIALHSRPVVDSQSGIKIQLTWEETC